MKRILVFLYLLSTLNSQLSTVVHAGVGQSGARMLNQTVGARSAGLGGAFTALADDGFGFYYNPAGLTQIKNSEFGTMYLSGLTDEYYALVSGVKRVGEQDVLGVGAFYFNGGDFEWNRVDEPVKTIKAMEDVLLTFGYGRQEKKIFSWGLNLKYYSSKLLEEYKTSAYALDLGMLLKVYRGLKTGLSLQNLGTKIKYLNEKDPLPLTGRWGIAYQKKLVRNHFSLVAEFIYRHKENSSYALGTEYVLARVLALRAGYGAKQATVGIGIAFEEWNFDYAFMPMSNFQSRHFVSLTYKPR